MLIKGVRQFCWIHVRLLEYDKFRIYGIRNFREPVIRRNLIRLTPLESEPERGRHEVSCPWAKDGCREKQRFFGGT